MPKALDLTEFDLVSPTRCAPLSDRKVIDSATAVEIAARLKALADSARLQIVSLLLCAPDRRLRTTDIAPAIGTTEATVSHHLKQLLATGVVTRQRAGMNVYYTPSPDALRALARVLDVGRR
jgi:ArsR family transcriptional regulator, arsenate/arsenite/antimonite-responsive transcriptional repressor